MSTKYVPFGFSKSIFLSIRTFWRKAPLREKITEMPFLAFLDADANGCLLENIARVRAVLGFEPDVLLSEVRQHGLVGNNAVAMAIRSRFWTTDHSLWISHTYSGSVTDAPALKSIVMRHLRVRTQLSEAHTYRSVMTSIAEMSLSPMFRGSCSCQRRPRNCSIPCHHPGWFISLGRSRTNHPCP